MSYQRIPLVVLLLLAPVIPTTVHAAAERAAISSEIGHRVSLRTSDLRSANLIRAGIVQYEAGDESPQNTQRQLRRHFDVVLSMLLAATPAHIETAIDRLESATGQRFSDAARQHLRGQLVTRRYAQLVRLKAYRDRGLFPRNEGETRGATPIFVDHYDTACAVGHLMRVSGWKAEVASIQAENNLVYIPDIAGGPVARWILTSGLTIDEAALIQPAYGWLPQPIRPAIPDDAIKPVASNWSGIAGDLRFSNFTLLGAAGPDTPPVNIKVSHTVCGTWFCSAPFWPYVPLQPVGEFTLNKDYAESFRSLPLHEGDAGSIQSFGSSNLIPYWPEYGELSSIVIQFDVETVSPSQRLASLPYASTLLTYADQAVTYGRNEVALFLSDDDIELFFHYAADGTDDSKAIDTSWVDVDESFEPMRKMTVVTELLLSSGQPYEAQRLHFDIITIPEPCAVLLLACSVALSCFRRWRLIR